ncbi:hypothetical protein Kuja_1630 [Vibrio phage vB_VchM_Kuja]|uniref:Uncharacterized protein n=1 Tax=Vibrio phage vB_VchM_Kuja TaxID=2686437 RepID=A0A6B9J7X2_9CAUD|nr:hypothetical protein HWC83_gp073 [Vibrio phage vB_VchM_Kuja]QGZ16154.1 hypothetical protein Kuja_1630 [Vibrio phage vB_VchM_Kuja]
MLNPHEYNNAVLRIKERTNVIQTLMVLFHDEPHIRNEASKGRLDCVLSSGVKLNLNGGVCLYIRETAPEGRGLVNVYAIKNTTSKDFCYPVQHPSKENEEAFDDADPKEMWSDGEYAENRWNFIRGFFKWLKEQNNTDMKMIGV